MEFSRWQNLFVVLIMTTILTSGIAFALQNKNAFTKEAKNILCDESNISTASVSFNVYAPPKKLTNPPKIVKAIYVTGYSAGSKKYRDYLSALLNNTEINAVVIDIKGSDGYVTYNSSLGDVQKYKLCDYAISNIDNLISFLHNKNIYVIGRIAVFEDPVYSVARPNLAVYNKKETTDLSQPILWRDRNSLSWLDPASRDVWNYNISLAKDGFYHGFDEINFDYVRFPTDGKTGNAGFPFYDGKTEKSEVIKSFFQYARQELANEKISVDLFGLTTVNKDDMGIGQIIENAFLNFDYVCPMVYPSHYANGFIGYENPADYPYDVIQYSLQHALNREKIFGAGNNSSAVYLAKFRPWLQDFNMGAYYTADMVKQEIKATQDSLGENFAGFMLWNPKNIYTEQAIQKPN